LAILPPNTEQLKTSDIINRIREQKNIDKPAGVRNAYLPEEAAGSEPQKNTFMITRVTARPNPFFTTITLDVVCEQSRHTIVRMFDMDNRIVKMFSWYLVKGTNVTTINELNSLSGGTYFVDIIDSEANVLYATKLRKEVA
jgi:hypothetical protein